MKQRMQKGFTLIELMIVVAIIGILAAVAVPQYQDYTIRSQVSEAVTLMNEHKTAIQDFYADKGRFASTASANSYGLSATPAFYTGTYVSQIAVAGTTGVVSATLGNKISAKVTGTTNVLSVGPAVNAAGNLVWVCGKALAPTGATGLAAAVGTSTTVSARYLPTSCRA